MHFEIDSIVLFKFGRLQMQCMLAEKQLGKYWLLVRHACHEDGDSKDNAKELEDDDEELASDNTDAEVEDTMDEDAGTEQIVIDDTPTKPSRSVAAPMDAPCMRLPSASPSPPTKPAPPPLDLCAASAAHDENFADDLMDCMSTAPTEASGTLDHNLEEAEAHEGDLATFCFFVFCEGTLVDMYMCINTRDLSARSRSERSFIADQCCHV